MCCSSVALTAVSLGAQDILDKLDDALTLSAFDAQVRARISGLLDLEG
jgi:hypothetical protein